MRVPEGGPVVLALRRWSSAGHPALGLGLGLSLNKDGPHIDRIDRDARSVALLYRFTHVRSLISRGRATPGEQFKKLTARQSNEILPQIPETRDHVACAGIPERNINCRQHRRISSFRSFRFLRVV